MPRHGANSYANWNTHGHWRSYHRSNDDQDNDKGHRWDGRPDKGTPDPDHHHSCPSPEPVSATFITPLVPANNSGAAGFARLNLEGTTLTVDAVVTGLTPGEAHPFHIHGFLDDRASRTPTIGDDIDLDGFVETPEAQAFAIGPALVALTTTDAIALAPHAPDFPVADENGTLVFNETYELDPNNRNDALILEELGDRTAGRALEFHGINLPAGEGAGTPYEVNGTGGYIPDVPAAGGILAEARGAFGELVASLTPEEFNQAALSILTALNNPPADDGGTDGTDTYFAILTPSNNSAVTGAALVTFDEEGGTVTVAVEADGLTPGKIHPQHIHGFENDTPSRLPTIALDTDLDGFIETPEGETAIGPVILSLTASGEVVPEGDPQDFPIADENGTLSFKQTYQFDLSDADDAFIFDQLQDRVAGRALELHGLDIPAGEGAGTPYEVNGTGGYIPILPVAGGLLLPLDESNPVVTALLQDHQLLI
jgi:hypothetical protein